VLITVLKVFGAVVLLTITVLRLPVVLNRNRSHAAWTGALLGALVLSINELFLPYAQLDSWFGGHNWLHLVRNVLVLGAMWALRVALFEALQERPWTHGRKRLEAAAAVGVIAVMTLAFWSIDKSSTSMVFIPDHIGQLPALVYGTVYMLAAAGLMFDTAWRILRELRGGRRRRTGVRTALSLMCLGALSMGAASVIECFYMAADHLHTADGPLIVAAHDAFGPLFLSGAGLLAVGLLVLAASALIRRWHLGDRYYLGRLVALRQGSLRDGLAAAVRTPQPRSDLYQAVIATYDAESREEIAQCIRRDKVMKVVEQRFGG
jgi:hypothetical protein